MELPDTILSELSIVRPAEGELDEQTVLDAIAALKDRKPEPPAGQVMLDQTMLDTLVADATAGREAAATLREQRFELTWQKALDEGRAVPAQHDDFKALYALDADNTIKVLDSLPAVVSMAPAGSSGTTSTRRDGTIRLEAREGIDEGKLAIHERALALQAERTDLKYMDAIDIAIAEGVGA